MTMPGGDVGGQGPSGVSEPVAAGRRGADWVAVLAWCIAALVALVVAGLATVGFQKFAPHWPAISARWTTAALTVVESDPSPPFVAPLPGVPPGDGPDAPTATADNEEGRVITNPSWRVRPGPEYPNLAQRQGVESGQVRLTCPVSVEGRIQSCWIVSETPADAGFGQAALAGAVQARLQPRTVDGEAVESNVSFTVRFQLE